MDHSHLWAAREPSSILETEWENGAVSFCGVPNWTWGLKEWNAVAYLLVTPSSPSSWSTTGALAHVQDLHAHNPPPFCGYTVPVALREQRNLRVRNMRLQAWCWIYFDWTLLNRNRSILSWLYICFVLSLWDSFTAMLTLPRSQWVSKTGKQKYL